MAKVRKKFELGIKLIETTTAAGSQGELRVDSTDDKLKAYLDGAERSIVTADQTETLTSKSIDADNNTISNLEVDNLKAGVLNTSTALTGASDTQVPSALAVKTYVDDAVATVNEASEISYSNATSGLTATDVQAAIDEVDGNVDNLVTLSGVALDAVDLGEFTGSTIPDNQNNKQALQALETAHEDHLNDTVDAHDASAISNVPSGNLVATDVQGALNELQSDVDTRALNSDLTTHTSASSGVHGVTGSVVGTTDTQTLENKTLTGAIIDGATKFSAYVSEETQDLATSGTAVTLTAITKPIVRLTNASLVSITGISALEDASHGAVVTLVNTTANDITILNDQGTASERILTGADDIDLAPEASLLLKYDSITDKWRVIGGTGGGNSVIKAVAGENLAQNDAVYLSVGAADGGRTAGRAYKLDAGNDDRIEYVGLVKSAVSSGQEVKIVTGGIVKGFTGLSVGVPVYLDTLNSGQYVQPEPTTAQKWILRLGIAISSTQVMILQDQGTTAFYNQEVQDTVTIANNQVSEANIPNLLFDWNVTKKFLVDYALFRSTDSTSYAQAGRLRGVYNESSSTWLMSDDYSGENAGVTFTITSSGQIQYTSSNISGTGYVGTLEYRITAGDGVSISSGSSGGASGLNYISNPEFTANALGYSVYKDTDQDVVVDGTAGTPTGLSIDRSTSSPLRGAASGLIDKVAGASRRGEGVSFDFSIDAADQAKVLEISFDYTTTVNYVDGDIRVYIYDVTNGQVIEPSQRDLLANSGNASYKGYFQAAANSQSYRLIWHVATSTTLGYELKIDNVKVGPANALSAPNQVVTSLYRTASQTGINPNNSTVKILLDTVTVDTCGGADIANSQFVAPESGYYAVEGNIFIAATNVLNSSYTVLIGINNGADFVRGQTIIPPAATAFCCIAVGTLYLKKGDTVDLRINGVGNNSVNTLSTSSSQRQRNFLNVAKIASDSASVGSSVVACRATGGTTSFSSLTTLIFPTIETDTNGAYNPSNGLFTVPESGYYQVEASIRVNSVTLSSTENVSIFIRRNSESMAGGESIGNGSSNQWRVGCSSSFYANKGDTISVSGICSVTATLNGGLSNQLCISKISNPAIIPPTEFVGCSYNTNAGQANSGITIIKYEDRIYDSSNSYNVSTGEYVVPVTGKYLCICRARSASQAWAATQNIITYVYKGSTSIDRNPVYADATFTAPIASSVSSVVDCVKGDIITFRVAISGNPNLGTTPEDNIMSITKVG